MSILPNYETLPNREDFLNNQKMYILTTTPYPGMITITHWWTTYQLQLQKPVYKEINEHTYAIKYISPESPISKKYVYIDLGNGGILWIQPQSILNIKKLWNITYIDIQKWYGSFYIPEYLSWNIIRSWKYIYQKIQEINQEPRNTLINNFDKQRKNFIIHTIWGDIMIHPMIQYITKIYLSCLQWIFPKTYTNNLENYITLRNILNLSWNIPYLPNTSWIYTSKKQEDTTFQLLRKEIKKQINKPDRLFLKNKN